MQFISKPFKKLFKKDKDEQNNNNNNIDSNSHAQTSQKINPTHIMNKNEDYTPVHHSEQKNNLRELQFQKILEAPIIDYDKLKDLSWDGIPESMRHKSWKVLLKYLPTNAETQETTIKSKRANYLDMVKQYFGEEQEEEEKDDNEKKIYKLINDDAKRTFPDTPLFQEKKVYDILVRVLYIWNMRHPACGYVQGINDICTPFIIVLMNDKCKLDCDSLEWKDKEQLKNVSQQDWIEIECDTYWLLTRILDGVLDNYTNKYPGVKKCYAKVTDIFKRLDNDLLVHLENEDVDFYTNFFKWIICLLLRQFTPILGLRLFDTYLADDQGYSTFCIYLFTAIILKWSKKLKKMCFEEIMIFLQQIPTKEWKEDDLKMIIAEAYYYKSLFEKNSSSSQQN